MRLSFGMGAGGGRAVFGQNRMMKLPIIQPLNKARNDRASFSSFRNKGTPHLGKDGKLESEDIIQENDISGRHFLFDKSFTTLDRTRAVFPPLPSDFCRPANLHYVGFSKGISRIHTGRPFTLRPKLKYSTYNPVASKNNQKTYLHTAPSFPDPMIGAPHSFIHRISELSSLQGETVIQEKLKKIRKPPS